MARNALILLMMGFAAFFLCSVSSADVPHMINYQGKLTTAAGGCLNDTVEMTFSIYSDTLGPPADWSETQAEVVVKDGIFNVLLGSVDTIPQAVFDGNIKYLGVQVEADPEMRPLKPIVSVAYAYRAATADGGGGGDDGDWTFRITDTADTALITGGAWGIARYGNNLYGNADSTHVNLGVACTTGLSGQNKKYSTIGGGFRNTAGGTATVGGGRDNIASGGASTVAGGISNIASGVVATVGGGESNTASGGEFATVGGGWQNTASGNKSTVGGGEQNTAGISGYTTVGGGYHNRASETSATVGGGWWNTASNTAGTVAGGVGNTASGMYATVPGGYIDTAAGDYSLAAGSGVGVSSDADYTFAFGRDFTTSTPNAVIFHNSVDPIRVGIGTTAPDEELHVVGNIRMVDGNEAEGKVLTSDANGVGTWQPAMGGADTDWSLNLSDGNDTTLTTGGAWGIARYGNTLYGNADSTHVNLGVACTTGTSGQDYKYCTVGGGHGNTASGSYATVGGGYFNTARNEYATVGGGVGNTASGYLATVGGGLSNTAANAQATVGGGAGDTASGNYSTVPGGRSNKASGDYSFAAGRRAKANHSGSFVWADNANEDFASTGNNQFLIRASGGVGIGTDSPDEELHVVGNVKMVDGNQAAGYVLTSDASGVGTWQPAAAVADGDWTFRVTDGSDTALITGGAWGIARYGNTLYGTYDSTHVNLGVACITGTNTEDNRYCTVGGGRGNIAGGWSATVGGGQYNTANGFYASVSGGNNNSTSYSYATVGGGRNNDASADDATVSGGWGNTASGDQATVGGGYENTADYDGATVGGGSSNTARYNYATVGGGYGNTAISFHATVGGGHSDTASGTRATVGGGYHNIASGDSSTVGGGSNNSASAAAATVAGGAANLTGGTAATVGGGRNNKARGNYSVIAGGGGASDSDSNSALGVWSAIGGGKSNTVSNDYSIIGGGELNTASGNYSSVGGGQSNEAGNTATTVGGGLGNYAGGYMATIGGGNNNTASGRWSTIAGGVSNTADDTATTVGGGRNNKARGPYSVVAGGGGPTDSDSNSARGDWSTVSGGRSNTASGDHAVVGGGQGNWASDDHSTVGGGKDNSAGNGYATVAGGEANSIGGAYGAISGGLYNRIAYPCDYSAIPGGYADTLTLNADYSMGFGRTVYVDDGEHVIFFDGTYSGHFNLNRDHRDAAPSSYPIRVGTHAFNGNGAYLTSGGVWTDISSRSKKENFQQLDGDQVLDKIEGMPMTSWKFKGTEERHIGPVAEDFYRAFGCGAGIPEDDSTSIAAIDLAGVSLVAVRELTRIVREQQKEIQLLKTKIETLETSHR
jgi:hypothetical protein